MAEPDSNHRGELITELVEELYGRPERALPLGILAAALALGLLTRSISLAVSVWVLGTLAWRYWSARLVIDDLSLGPILLTCPVVGGDSKVWLTFDDGPGPETLAVIEELNRQGFSATFFFIGEQVEHYPDLPRLREVLELGSHSVANHTFSHPNLLKLNPEQVRLQLESTEAILRAYFPGQKVPLFRPPYGYRNRSVLDCAEELDLTPVGWSCNSLDFLSGPSERVWRRVARGTEEGTIVLLHDGRSGRQRTLEALPELLAALKNKGLGAYSPR